MRLVSIGGVASWLLGVIAVCCTTLHKSKGHILASFQLRPVERPNTAIPRHLPVYSDSDDSRSSSESRTIAKSIMKVNYQHITANFVDEAKFLQPQH